MNKDYSEVGMYEGSGTIKIFAGRTGRPFAQRMCDFLGTELGDSQTIMFSEGNIFVRINESIRDNDVFIVQPIARDPNAEFTELLFWIDAFKRSSANSVTAIIPYFSYAKGDKKDEPRVSIRARVCADCIETVGVDRVLFMDLHAAQIQGFFKKPVDHLYAQPLLCEYVRRQGLVDENLVVVAPDAGSAKRAHEFAKALGADVAIGDKTRYDHSEQAKILNIIGNVQGRNCLVVDDFSISGGTMVDIARGLREKGANRIFGALSHNAMNDKALQRIEESPYEWVVTTDTVECPEHVNYDKIRIISAAPLFAMAVKTIHDRTSMGNMLENTAPTLIKYISFHEQPKMN